MRRIFRPGSPGSSPRRRRLPPEFTAATTVEAARRRLAAALRPTVSDSADLDARVLVCAACGIDHAALIRDPERPLGAGAVAFAAFAARRLAQEPVSRILGRRDFWGLTLAVDPAVLDPRADTEGLVGAVLDAAGGRGDAALRLLDLGTGSGAILCALLSELPRAEGIGVDRSAAACRTAAGNLAANGLGDRGRIVCASWGDALGARFDVVVANPPYIASGDIGGLPPDVRDHDPLAALDGGADGLDSARAIVAQLDRLLAPGGVAALECGFDQGEAVAGLMRSAGLRGVTVYKDLAGHDRVVLATHAQADENATRAGNRLGRMSERRKRSQIRAEGS